MKSVYLSEKINWGRNYVELVKETQGNFKNLEDIPLEYAKEYLDYGVNVKGYSVYTTRLQASAIAKLYNVPIKSFYKVPSIATAKIKRSRGASAMDVHFSVENNKEFIDFCKGTGLRRRETIALKPEQIVIKNKFGSIKNAPVGYFCKGKNKGKHYNRAALQHVSSNLGHNRVSVVVSNYLDE